MTLEETTKLYEMVLRQLLPTGGYDRSPHTNIADDIYGHAKALAQCDLDAKRLLNVLESIPAELLEEYEKEYGLPLKCQTNVAQTVEERLAIVNWIRNTKNVLNTEYLKQILILFNVNLIELVKYRPMQCTTACNAPVNTDRLRYKVKLKLQNPVLADMDCIIYNYLPAYIRYDIEVI
ncbi:hypothetical protein B9T36_07195 [Acinetobacter sp. ANC 4204]|uniref:DUF2313 domain-containing protein n=1 Tax=Acinetobacter sp. ANC 4204 TaxID=1977884 RepID=UPI000A338881|nr:DUF2313 domain-containing protein [Acinetobacter sp. ANC 4204]OTG60485.1 hypothetical protein B9T36_07195 [Acinetobacter sp. ANC 4204]